MRRRPRGGREIPGKSWVQPALAAFIAQPESVKTGRPARLRGVHRTWAEFIVTWHLLRVVLTDVAGANADAVKPNGTDAKRATYLFRGSFSRRTGIGRHGLQHLEYPGTEPLQLRGAHPRKCPQLLQIRRALARDRLERGIGENAECRLLLLGRSLGAPLPQGLPQQRVDLSRRPTLLGPCRLRTLLGLGGDPGEEARRLAGPATGLPRLRPRQGELL